MRLTISRDIRYRLKSGIFIPVNRFREGVIIMPRGNADLRAEFQEVKDQITALEDILFGIFENNPREALTKEIFVKAISDFHHARSQTEFPMPSTKSNSAECSGSCHDYQLAVWRNPFLNYLRNMILGLLSQTEVGMANEIPYNLIVGNGGHYCKVVDVMSRALTCHYGLQWHTAIWALATLTTFRSTIGADMAVLTLDGIVVKDMTDGRASLPIGQLGKPCRLLGNGFL